MNHEREVSIEKAREKRQRHDDRREHSAQPRSWLRRIFERARLIAGAVANGVSIFRPWTAQREKA